MSSGMIHFVGSYDCKVDAKGRVLLPTHFRKELGDGESFCFVIKKHVYEQCLELYTKEAWDERIELLGDIINPFIREDQQVEREFRMGSTMVETDPTGRILIPARLLKQAEISADALLTGYKGRIEIWQPDLYIKSSGDDKERQERHERIFSRAKSKTKEV